MEAWVNIQSAGWVNFQSPPTEARQNATFAALDEALISASLAPT